MRAYSTLFVAVTAAILLSVPARGEAQVAKGRTVAIIANAKTAADGVGFAELRKIMMGEQQFWHDKSKIVLLVRASPSPERDVMLAKVYHMSEPQFRQYWIAKMFRAEVASAPKIAYTGNMAHELVKALPGAITFVLSSDVSPDVKVLRIDGKLPGDPGYPLQ